MSNGMLSRKGMVAVLASVMFTVTACSDKSKVKDLEGDNGRLRQQITQLENDKKSAEEKIAESNQKISELEAMSDALAMELDELKNADITIANLARQIEEKRTISENLDKVLVKVRAEKAQAESDLELARANEAMAKAGGEKHTADANRLMNVAAVMSSAVIKRAEELAKQEERILKAQSKLEVEQARIDEVARQWKGLYSEHKLDALFERLTDEDKMNDAVTFQYSVVALNVSVQDIRNIRNRISKLQNASSNIYKNDKKISPSDKYVNDIIKALAAKVNVDKSKASNAFDKVSASFSARGSQNRVMNDNYMAKATGAEIISLRDDLKKMSTGNRAIFIVPRLVEKLSVSMVLRVNVNAGSTVLDRRIRKAVSTTLSKPKEVDVDLSKEIDVKIPMNSMFSTNQCKKIDADCLKALARSGLLNKRMLLNGKSQTIKKYLHDQFLDSADQSQADMQELNDGRLESSVVGNWVVKTFGPSHICYAEDLSEYDCSAKLEEAENKVRVKTIEQISIEFNVNQIQELPSTGNVPVDFAVDNNFEKLALNLSDGRLHIQLPIKSSRSVVLDVEGAAKDIVKDTYGTKKVGDRTALSRVLSVKASTYMDYVRALK